MALVEAVSPSGSGTEGSTNVLISTLVELDESVIVTV